uniref:Uncharacterized protein n=1 Tax=Triticum urartu TaxID=4572 RepID=A0A8R7UU54_TRIUA
MDVERPGRLQPPLQAVQRHLRRRFIVAATWIPLVPTSDIRSSTSSLSCSSVAQLLHLVEVTAFRVVKPSHGVRPLDDDGFVSVLACAHVL